MENTSPEQDLAPIAAALYQGQKIEAIKRYRELRGVGLKEAKDAVEVLEAGLRERSPEKFSALSSRAGCLGVLLLMLCTVSLAGLGAVAGREL